LGTEVGGLSGIDYLPASGRFATISDERTPQARFYTVTLPIAPNSVGPVSFVSVTNLRNIGGGQFTTNTIDPEGIRAAPGGGFLWSSEGNASLGIGTSIFRMGADGVATGTITPPAHFAPGPGVGIRNNLAFEGITIAPGGTTLFAGTEAALAQDGPIATLANGSNARIVRFDLATGTVTGEFVYQVSPIPRAPVPAGSAADNGLPEILAVDDHTFVMLERSFANGVGNTIRLYLADLSGATNVQGIDDLDNVAFTPMSKTFLADLSALGVTSDNVEGITWGPTLETGERTLVLVADNNFSTGQVTQFIVLAVPEPASIALLAAALMLLVALRRRHFV
jgi:hypothetical protein